MEELIIFALKLIGGTLLALAYFYLMGRYLAKIDKECFEKVFKDHTEEEKQKAKAIMNFIENNH